MMKRHAGGRTFSRLFTGLVFLFLYAPIFLLIVFSFNKGNSNIVWSGFSLDWYRSLFHDRLIMRSVYTTLLVSLLATVIATAAGTFAAIGFYSLRRRQRAVLNTVNNIPMMNADIVTGVAMCLFFVAFFTFWGDFSVWFNGVQSLVVLPERLTLGFGTLLIAHVTFDIPYVILSVGPKLRQMDKDLVDAAQDLGCTWMQAFWKVILPEIKPGIASGALTAFTMSVDDFIISYFTAGSSSSTLAMTIYGMTKKRVTPEINAVSTLLFVTVLTLLVIVNLRSEREREERRPDRLARRIGRFLDSPRGKLASRSAAGVLTAGFLVAVTLLAKATNAQPVVNVCSWGEYIDEELIGQFEEETGIIVNYQTAESNEALYSLLKSGAGDYDVVVPSDYMISQLIEEDMLEELDYRQIPNYALIDSRFKGLTYDPQERYTVPYAWGTVGIIYNTTMVDGPITSWSALFDSRYAGNVLMFRNSRDAMATALSYLGHSLNTTDEAELREAFRLLKDAKGRGVYQSFVMDEIFQKLEGGNAAIGAYYAGDYLTMLENNEDLAFVVPEEGSNWFMDAMCVLKGAPHYEEALAWIDFIASTEANLKNMDYLWYASPNREALEQYPAYYEELYGEELDQETYEIIAAPKEVLDRCEAYLVLPQETRKLYNDLWTELGI
ncbi:extracellular solute-binding protein [uncultured Oscillibacter sp.]|uniref:extracellular solute-binding protein n=2 Tax=uncultured Oscillibacter sp. TaxID=876091 RepID=UPI00262961A7|nr:extracellular solute-binding protein [uncultured Oscillibacter sp.]